MTCRKTKPPGVCEAYTFLEVAIALGLIAILFATVFPVVSASQQERRLRQALDAVSESVSTQRLEVVKTGVEQDLILAPDGLARREGEEVVSLARIPSGLIFKVKFPGGDWEKANEQEWRIFASGAVAPLSVRLEQGPLWIEADFDFLTGSVAAERYTF